jgi:hypothetical protein
MAFWELSGGLRLGEWPKINHMLSAAEGLAAAVKSR